jgi:hypothetical protein
MIYVSDDFDKFCKNLSKSDDEKETVSRRFHNITQRINLDFRGTDSCDSNSFYVGSYGRGTQIYLSDIDMVVVLPYETYVKFNNYASNGQSALLQAVKESISKTYSSSEVGGDGQVVVVNFADGIRFEIVPSFLNKDGSYTYPDSNDGGQWKTMDPKSEISAFKNLNNDTNGNFNRLCRMGRAWNTQNKVCMKGILLDTIAYRFLSVYQYKDKSYEYYDWISRDFFKYLYDNSDQSYWEVPGSGWHVSKKYSFRNESKSCYDLALDAIDAASKDYPYTMHQDWRKIYGTDFPDKR